MVMDLLWILPTIVVVGAMFDASLVAIYMYIAHPWIGILSTEEAPKPENEQEGEDTRFSKVSF